ncbi:hypothetical protein BC829DRAFT_430713 [Chytridium lagenaria]|nr:hypothetical protein BC829DRAFT_430713 [Chytridium lagenaria]
MPPSTYRRNRAPAVVSVATTATCLFPDSQSEYRESKSFDNIENDLAPVSGEHILQVFNRVRRFHGGSSVSERWQVLRPLAIQAPVEAREPLIPPTSSIPDTASKSPPSAKAVRKDSKRDTPMEKSPAAASPALQYQSMGLFAALPPGQSLPVQGPKPKPPPEPEVPIAYTLRITSTESPSDPAKYFPVSIVLAEALATAASFFHFLEKQHIDTLEKALQITFPPSSRGLLSPPASPEMTKPENSIAGSLWTISSLLPNRPEMQAPVFQPLAHQWPRF